MSSELGLLLRNLSERVDPTLLLERVVGGPPDPWQRDLLSLDPGDTAMVLASRRIGKSTTVGAMAAQELAKDDHTVIIISPTLSQSQLLFAKIAHTWDLIGLPIGVKRRTLTELTLANRSSVVCVPAGQDGEGARGYGVRDGMLIYDEAAFTPDKVFSATLPIAEDNARTILITTPGGKSGKAFGMWTAREDYPEVRRIRACSLDLPRMEKTVARARRNLSRHDFEIEHGLQWICAGRPYFDRETITSAFTDTPPLELGNFLEGVTL